MCIGSYMGRRRIGGLRVSLSKKNAAGEGGVAVSDLATLSA
jgi:hypothetical protein